MRGDPWWKGNFALSMPKGEGMQFVAESGSGHAIVVDDAKGHSGAAPIELALLALGAEEFGESH